MIHGDAKLGIWYQLSYFKSYLPILYYIDNPRISNILKSRKNLRKAVEIPSWKNTRLFFSFFALGDENNMKEAKINPNSYVNFFVYLLLSVDFDVLLYTHLRQTFSDWMNNAITYFIFSNTFMLSFMKHNWIKVILKSSYLLNFTS